METARPAGADDLSTVLRLVAEFVTEQRAQRGGEVWAAQDGGALCDPDARRAGIADPNHLTLLGAIDDVPIGVLLARLDALDDGTTLAVIDALYVEPDARAVGVGSSMLDAVIAWAEDRGARGVDATVLPGNRGGKNFFEMHGLVARAIRVFRAVGEG
jgi:GNAT superfamily N-acetyltransferase